MNKRALLALIFFTLIWCGPARAGALDRTGTQPRTNPVSQSMIRVPGVVGLEKATAISTLQQAGLNVSIQTTTKKHAGLECKVVKQTPSPGGMAMYGTTVTVSIYTPEETKCETSSSPWGQNTGTTTWTPLPSTSTQNQPYYPSQGQSTGGFDIQSQPSGGTLPSTTPSGGFTIPQAQPGSVYPQVQPGAVSIPQGGFNLPEQQGQTIQPLTPTPQGTTGVIQR